MVLKAKELLEITENELQIFVPGDYLAQLYHSDFMDTLKKYSSKLNITLLTENSLKGRFFMSKMNWVSDKCRVVDVKNLPCFIVSDRKELLIAMQENDETEDVIDKKKPKMVALWTNYKAFVETLLVLFSKLHESSGKVQEVEARTPR